jgi:hypothetical protein
MLCLTCCSCSVQLALVAVVSHCAVTALCITLSSQWRDTLLTLSLCVHVAVTASSEKGTGKGSAALESEGARRARLLRLRSTLQNVAWLGKFAATVSHLRPTAPVTGTTLMERRGLLQVLELESMLLCFSCSAALFALLYEQ